MVNWLQYNNKKDNNLNRAIRMLACISDLKFVTNSREIYSLDHKPKQETRRWNWYFLWFGDLGFFFFFFYLFEMGFGPLGTSWALALKTRPPLHVGNGGDWWTLIPFVVGFWGIWVLNRVMSLFVDSSISIEEVPGVLLRWYLAAEVVRTKRRSTKTRTREAAVCGEMEVILLEKMPPWSIAICIYSN